MKILILSSLSPYESSYLGLDQMNALIKAGHNVSFLSKYKYDNMIANMYSVFDYEKPKIKEKFSSKIKHLLKKYFRNYVIKYKARSTSFMITSPDEENPPIPVDLIINKLDLEYDLIITLFWEGLISSKTINELYTQYGCPIIIQPVDMAPMTGGCYYFGNCREFLNSCEKCPVAKKFKTIDQPKKNFLYKKSVYANIKCAYSSNIWVSNWARQSGIISPQKIKTIGFVLNENQFRPFNKSEARKILGLPEDRFIAFSGAANINVSRKGFNRLVEAINFLPKNVTSKLLLVVASRDSLSIESLFNIDVCNIGFLDSNRLSLMYSASDVFLSSTIDDAGPSMVNQSLMCGTPVIAFKVGVALELVENMKNGYLAELGDSYDFAIGISKIIELMSSEEASVRNYCREVAMLHNSYDAFSKRIMNIYKEIKEK